MAKKRPKQNLPLWAQLRIHHGFVSPVERENIERLSILGASRKGKKVRLKSERGVSAISCESDCEGFCQNLCEHLCLQACEHNCKTGCQTNCQQACLDSCEAICEYNCRGHNIAIRPEHRKKAVRKKQASRKNLRTYRTGRR